jgi:uncharacterized protein
MLACVALTALLAHSSDDSALLAQIIAAAREGTSEKDATHDWQHVERVTETARVLATAEGAHLLVSAAAAMLHELVALPKSDPESYRGATPCAAEAVRVLAKLRVSEGIVARVAVCIEEHPFSLGARPSTLESAVLQDADRLDAIGAIGIARCLATAGTLGRPYYSENDPFCRQRPPDDRRWALDHFYRKLLRIPDHLSTATARRMAEPRVGAMQAWLVALEAEIEGTTS